MAYYTAPLLLIECVYPPVHDEEMVGYIDSHDL